MIPKPKYCEQNWLTMQKTEGGHICADCNKLMTDFTKMSWSKIEQIHTDSNEPVCGMYAQKQLDNWGREVPSAFSKCSKSTAVLTSIFAALNFQSVEAKPLGISSEAIHFSPVEIGRDSIPKKQKEDVTEKTISIFGKIVDSISNEPLIGATVVVEDTNTGAITNIDGSFELKIPDSLLVSDQMLQFLYFGYQTKSVLLTQPIQNPIKLVGIRGMLTSEELSYIGFGIRKPSRWQHFKFWVKNLFK